MARYIPPPADSTAPLDEVQRAIVELLVARTVQRIRAEVEAEQQAGDLDRTTAPRTGAATR